MKRLSCLVVMLLPGLVWAQERIDFNYHSDFEKILQKSRESSSRHYYPRLLERFQRTDTTLTNQEMVSMLIGYTADEYYAPYEQMQKEWEIYSLNAKKAYQEAIAQCEALLETYPFSLLGNRELSYSYYKLGRRELQDLYFKRFKMLYEAVLSTGSGFSYDDSIFVLGPADGQTLIRFVFFKDIGSMGSGSDRFGYFHDLLEFEHEDSTYVLHLNIDHARKNSSIFKELEALKALDEQ